MKKIILILLLTIFVCLAVAEDMDKLDKEKYMPQKLIINELPDDYPQELEYCFYKTYKFFQEISTIIDSLKFQREKFRYKKFFKILPKIRKKYRTPKMLYLSWFANNIMPAYYGEYKTLNSKFIYDILKETDMDKELYRKSIFLKFFPESHNSLRLGRSMGYIDIGGMLQFIWLRVKILESQEIQYKTFEGYMRPTYSLKVEVLEDFSGVFPHKQFELNARISGSVRTRQFLKKQIIPPQKGEEYLIPFRWARSLGYKIVNGKREFEYVHPFASFIHLMKINNEQLEIFNLKEKGPSSHQQKSIIQRYFGNSCSYQKAKSIIKDKIDKLKKAAKGEI